MYKFFEVNVTYVRSTSFFPFQIIVFDDFEVVCFLNQCYVMDVIISENFYLVYMHVLVMITAFLRVIEITFITTL